MHCNHISRFNYKLVRTHLHYTRSLALPRAHKCLNGQQWAIDVRNIRYFFVLSFACRRHHSLRSSLTLWRPFYLSLSPLHSAKNKIICFGHVFAGLGGKLCTHVSHATARPRSHTQQYEYVLFIALSTTSLNTTTTYDGISRTSTTHDYDVRLHSLMNTLLLANYIPPTMPLFNYGFQESRRKNIAEIMQRRSPLPGPPSSPIDAKSSTHPSCVLWIRTRKPTRTSEPHAQNQFWASTLHRAHYHTIAIDYDWPGQAWPGRTEAIVVHGASSPSSSSSWLPMLKHVTVHRFPCSHSSRALSSIQAHSGVMSSFWRIFFIFSFRTLAARRGRA